MTACPSGLPTRITHACYHPGWVYHGLLTGPATAAALLLDRLLRGDLRPHDCRVCAGR